METLQMLCNLIILIGGACVAVKNISEWLGKPIRIFRKRSDENFKNRVVEVLNEVLPEILLNHDLDTRTKYLNDRQNYLNEIKDEVLLNIKDELEQITHLTEQYKSLVISAKDVLREKIMAVYHKNKKDRNMTLHEKEALDQYYIDYKAMKGNSYIDKYYTRMTKWSIIEDDYTDDDAL